MPTVPTSDGFNVAPQTFPGVRVDSIANADDFGGIQARQTSQLGQATQALGADLTAMATDAQERQNADSLFRAETQLKADALQFHADQSQRKGVNAWDMTKDASKWWDDAGRKYSEGLTNDAQRAAFAKTYTGLRVQNLARTSIHEDEQRRGSLEESAKASMVGSINNAAANYSTPGAVMAAVDDITGRTRVVAKLNGWTPERAAIEEQTNLTSLHKQVLQNMVQANPDEASGYYDRFKEQILGTERDGVEKLIKGAKFTKSAESFGDQVIASGMTEGEAIAATREKFSGEEEKQVVLEVKTRFQEKSKAREDGQRDAADQAFGIYARTGRLSAIPQALKDQLDGRVLISLQHEAETKAKGHAVKTDPNTYYELRTQAAQDPKAFAERDLRGDFAKLDEADREKFINMQQSVKHPAKQKEIATLSSQLSDAHELQGWKANDGEKRGSFDRAVTNALDVEQERVGRPLDFKERQTVIDRYMIEGKVSGAGFLGIGGGKKFYEVVGTVDEDKFAPKVPDRDRKLIEAALTKAGRPVTADAVLRLYKSKNGL